MNGSTCGCQAGRLIDELTRKGRLVRRGETVTDAHKAAFTAYVRKGDATTLTELEGLSLEGKALSVGSEADGGYLVPEATAECDPEAEGPTFLCYG